MPTLQPWHMWGSTVELQASEQPLFSQLRSAQQQIARVSYKRPESWRFFLHARVFGPETPVGPDVIINVRFNVLFGVGRSATMVEKALSVEDGFARMQWIVIAGRTPQSNGAKWTSEVSTPLLVDSDVASSRQVSVIPAQDIQIGALMTAESAGGISGEYRASVAAYLAPNVHVRPDWYEGQFWGNERAGT